MSDSAPERIVVAGPDEDGIADALDGSNASVQLVEGSVTRPALEDAGILDADLYVLTDVGEATSIPIVCDLVDDVKTVVYARDSVPEFVRGQLDLAVDPALLDPETVAEELRR